MKIKFLYLIFLNFFFRNGSVVVDYLIYFELIKNDIVFFIVRRILIEGVNNMWNILNFRVFGVDIEIFFVEGELRIKI